MSMNCTAMIDRLTASLNTSVEASFVQQVHVLLNQTVELQIAITNILYAIIPGNELYSFLNREENVVKLNFRLTLASDIMYETGFFPTLYEQLEAAQTEISETLLNINKTLGDIQELCEDQSGSDFCTKILPFYMTHRFLVYTMLLNSESHRNTALGMYTEVAQAAQADPRITSVHCLTDQHHFYM